MQFFPWCQGHPQVCMRKLGMSWIMALAFGGLLRFGSNLRRRSNKPPGLSKFRSVFSGDGVSLLAGQFLARFAGSMAGLAKEAIQPRGRHDP